MTINEILLLISLGTLGLISLAAGLVVYLFFKSRNQKAEDITQSSLMEEKFNSFSNDIKEISKELASVTTPVNELNRFLGGNVTTGRLAEWNLESIVQEIMPDGNYQFQHMINPQTNHQVDCAVTTAEGVIIPIDSKFYPAQYRNYQEASTDAERQAVLQRLKTSVLNDAADIADKYILQNTTTNYAVLYIASEKMIDLIDKIDDLRQECFTDKKILIQGPNTVAAFLDTIRAGHHYLKLNETAERVASVVRDIQKQFSNFDDSTEKVLKKLDAALREVNSLQTRINVLGSTLERGADSLEEAEEGDQEN